MRGVCFLACVLAGCAELSGLDGLGVCDGAACEDATSDVTSGDSATPDVRDGGPLPQVEASAPFDAQDDITCTRPIDCNGVSASDAGKVCCDTITLVGKYPTCTVAYQVTECKKAGDCPSSFVYACVPEVLRRCSTGVDCTEAAYPKCCDFVIEGAKTQLCATSAIATASGGNCP